MNLLIYKTTDELNKDLADYIIKIAEVSIEENNRFNFVLTGGNSPKELYSILSSDCKNRIDWEKVYFFFGDERNVPPNDKDYNGLMAKQYLFEPLAIATDHIFYVNTTLLPEDAAKAYMTSIEKHFENEEVVFDLILLGMGDDAHTASIFPDTSLVKAKKATVLSVFVEKLGAFRISLTAPLINRADNVAFLVFGENKAEAINHVMGNSPKDYDKYPSQLIDPIDGKLIWFVDEKAVSLLQN